MLLTRIFLISFVNQNGLHSSLKVLCPCERNIRVYLNFRECFYFHICFCHRDTNYDFIVFVFNHLLKGPFSVLTSFMPLACSIRATSIVSKVGGLSFSSSFPFSTTNIRLISHWRGFSNLVLPKSLLLQFLQIRHCR